MDIAKTLVTDSWLVQSLNRQEAEEFAAGQTARTALDKADLSNERLTLFIVKPHVQFLANLFVCYFNRKLLHVYFILLS
ncbi:MAG: hypothetical protein QX196_12250 [Methylococcaceae bacterium]